MVASDGMPSVHFQAMKYQKHFPRLSFPPLENISRSHACALICMRVIAWAACHNGPGQGGVNSHISNELRRAIEFP